MSAPHTPDAHPLHLVVREIDESYARADEAQQRGNRMQALFVEALRHGTDLGLPLAPGEARLYPISSHLGECSREAQALLFAACRLALIHKDREAAEALRVFVESVAREFGDGHAVAEGE